MNNKVSVFGQRRAGVYLLSEIYNPDDVTSSVQNINKVIPAIGSLVVDDTVGNHNTLYVVYSVDAVTHRSTLVNANILDTTDGSDFSLAYGKCNYKLFFNDTVTKVYYRTQDTSRKAQKNYYVKNSNLEFVLFTGNNFENGVEYYESIDCYEVAIDGRLNIFNNNAVNFSVWKTPSLNAVDFPSEHPDETPSISSTEVLTWFYNLDSDIDLQQNGNPPSSPATLPTGAVLYDELGAKIDGVYNPYHKIPLTTYIDSSIDGAGETVTKTVKCPRLFYTPIKPKQGEKYLLEVEDARGKIVAQTVLEGQPMLALQELNWKYRIITAFNIYTNNETNNPNLCYIPRWTSRDHLQFYFDIQYNDGSVDHFPGIDNVRIFAYGLDGIDTTQPIGTRYKVLFKYFVPSVEQVSLNASSSIPNRNYEVGPTKRYIYKIVTVEIADGVPVADIYPPVCEFFTQDPTAPTNGRVIVKPYFTDDSEVTIIQYRIGENGEWTNGTVTRETRNGVTYFVTSVPVTENNTTIYVKAWDSSDNVSLEYRYIVTNIDKEGPAAPTYTLSPDLVALNETPRLTTTNVIVTPTFADETGIQNYYRVGNGEWGVWSRESYTATDNKVIYFKSVDLAGNSSEVTECNIACIDRTAPIIAIHKSAPINNTVNVTANVSNNSKPAETYVNRSLWYLESATELSENDLDNLWRSSVGWTAYPNGGVTATENGYIYFRACDGIYDGTNSHYGNISVTRVQVTEIDSEVYAPVITANPTTLTNQDVYATISYHDVSTIKQYFISDIEIDPSTFNNWISVNPNDLTAGPNGTVLLALDPITQNCYIYAREGNDSGTDTDSYTIDYIDKTPPSVISASTNPPQNQLTNGSVLMTPVFSDDAVQGYYTFTLGNQNSWQTYSEPVEVTENRYVYFKCVDEAGNVSEVRGFPVDNIQRADLSISFTQEPPANVYTKNNVTVTISYDTTNYDSPITTRQYRLEGESTWHNYTGPVPVSENTVIYAKCSDGAGNEATNHTSIGNIDKIAPTVSLQPTDPPQDTWTHNTVKVKVTASDTGGSGLNRIEFSKDDGTTWYTYTITPNNDGVTMNTNGTVLFRAVDTAGNVSEQVSQPVANIDKLEPTVTCDISSAWARSKTIYPVFTDPAAANGSGQSGIKTKLYKIGENGAETAYDTATGITVTENNTDVYVKAVDNADNTSGWVKFTVTNIDNAYPEVQITASNVQNNTEVWTNQDVTITPTITDLDGFGNAGSGVKNVYYRIKYNNESTFSNWIPYILDEEIVNPGSQITMTRNGTIQFKTEDVAGNVSPIDSTTFGVYNVTKIDKDAPVINLSGNNTTSATSSTCTATLANNENLTIYYKFSSTNTEPLDYNTIDTDDWTPYSGSITVNSNGTYYFKAVDLAGNVGVNSRTYNNIVTSITPATIELSTTAPTNTNITATITYGNDSTDRYYYISNSATELSTAQLDALAANNWTIVSNNPVNVPITENCWIYAKSENVSGHRYDTCHVTNIDKINPIVTATASNVSNGVEQWTNQDVTVTATFDDVGLGLATTHGRQYSTDSGVTWTDYTGAIPVSQNTNFIFKATDKAGNTKTYAYNVTKIDKDAPATPTFVASPPSGPTNQDVTVTPTFSGETGTTKEYSLDGTTWIPYTTPIVLEQNGDVYFRETDPAGNTSGVAHCVVDYIDKIPPAAPIPSADRTAITNQNVTVTATFSLDSVTQEYSLNGTTWNPYTTGIVFTQNGTVYFRGTDAAGNVSQISSYAVTNIDKIPPDQPTASADIIIPTNQNVTVSAVFSEDSAVKQYSLDGTNWSNYTDVIIMTDNGPVYFRGRDAAGNFSDVTTYNVTNIDRIPPDRPVASANITTPTHQNVIVTATFSDDSAVKEYSLDGGTTWSTYSSSGITFTQNGTVKFRAKDAAGNVSDIETYTVSNIAGMLDAPTFSLNPPLQTQTLGPVEVTITYDSDSRAASRMYSTDNVNWTLYTEPVSVANNNTTVYAKCDDGIYENNTYTGEVSSSVRVTNITTSYNVTPVVTSNNGFVATVTITTTESDGVTGRATDLQYKYIATVGDTTIVYPNPAVDGYEWANVPNDVRGSTHTFQVNGVNMDLYFKATDANGIVATSTPLTVRFTIPDEPEITD